MYNYVASFFCNGLYAFYGRSICIILKVFIISDIPHKNPEVWNLATESSQGLPAKVFGAPLWLPFRHMAYSCQHPHCSPQVTPSLILTDRLYLSLPTDSSLHNPKNAKCLLISSLSTYPLSFPSLSHLPFTPQSPDFQLFSLLLH